MAFPLLLLASLLASAAAYAPSCAAGAPSAGDACCNMLERGGDYSGWLKVRIALEFAVLCPPSICGECSADNTAQSQRVYDHIRGVTTFFQSYRCWGGALAAAPGDDVSGIGQPADWLNQVARLNCNTEALAQQLTVWSDFSNWTATRTRTCSTPGAPYNRSCAGNAVESSVFAPTAAPTPAPTARAAAATTGSLAHADGSVWGTVVGAGVAGALGGWLGGRACYRAKDVVEGVSV